MFYVDILTALKDGEDVNVCLTRDATKINTLTATCPHHLNVLVARKNQGVPWFVVSSVGHECQSCFGMLAGSVGKVD